VAVGGSSGGLLSTQALCGNDEILRYVATS
jgi:hypothetical protein